MVRLLCGSCWRRESCRGPAAGVGTLCAEGQLGGRRPDQLPTTALGAQDLTA
jgi:hypothetical protein